MVDIDARASRGRAGSRRARRSRRQLRPTRLRRSVPRWAARAGPRSISSAARRPSALGFDSLAKGGKMIMVGLFGGAAPWSLPLIPMKAATHRGQLTPAISPRRANFWISCAPGRRRNIPIRTRPLAEATDSARRPEGRPHRWPRRTDALTGTVAIKRKLARCRSSSSAANGTRRRSGKTLPVVDPRRARSYDTIPRGEAADIDAAVTCGARSLRRRLGRDARRPIAAV